MRDEYGLVDVRTADWTLAVRRFWPAVITSALRPRALWGLLRSGWSTLRGAVVMPLMIRGQRRGVIKFALSASPLRDARADAHGSGTEGACVRAQSLGASRRREVDVLHEARGGQQAYGKRGRGGERARHERVAHAAAREFHPRVTDTTPQQL
jgi:hypothetical protein